MPIPAEILEALGLRENDRVELMQSGNSVWLRKASPAVPHKTLDERLTSFYGMPIEQIPRAESREIDWGEPAENEIG